MYFGKYYSCEVFKSHFLKITLKIYILWMRQRKKKLLWNYDLSLWILYMVSWLVFHVIGSQTDHTFRACIRLCIQHKILIEQNPSRYRPEDSHSASHYQSLGSSHNIQAHKFNVPVLPVATTFFRGSLQVWTWIVRSTTSLFTFGPLLILNWYISFYSGKLQNSRSPQKIMQILFTPILIQSLQAVASSVLALYTPTTKLYIQANISDQLTCSFW